MTTRGALFGVESTDPFLNGVKTLAESSLPPGWKDGRLLPAPALADIKVDRNRLRFALPTLELVKLFVPGDNYISERKFKLIKAALLGWTLGKALITNHSEFAKSLRPSDEDFSRFVREVQHLRGSILSGADVNRILANKELGDTIRTTSGQNISLSILRGPSVSPCQRTTIWTQLQPVNVRLSALEERLKSVSSLETKFDSFSQQILLAMSSAHPGFPSSRTSSVAHKRKVNPPMSSRVEGPSRPKQLRRSAPTRLPQRTPLPLGKRIKVIEGTSSPTLLLVPESTGTSTFQTDKPLSNSRLPPARGHARDYRPVRRFIPCASGKAAQTFPCLQVPRHYVQLDVSPVRPSLCSAGLLAVNQLGGRCSAQLGRSNYCLLCLEAARAMQPQYHRSSEGSGLVSSTLGRWTDPSISSTLSSDPVILKTLKGIQALRPRQEGRRIRDVHQLRLWISWNPPSLSSFFEISPACCYLTPLSLGA
uniref:Uncharacterized protein n=1 Tax=Cacopsylla melanoneura TaxID=428564 RepID=A0A8D8U0Q7_9HEMI